MKVYKYVSPALLSVLQDWLVRFTQAIEFNDPFEMRPHISRIASDELLNRKAEEGFEGYVLRTYNHMPFAVRRKISSGEFMRHHLKDKIKYLEQYKAQVIEGALPEAKARAERMINENIGVFCVAERPDDLLMWAHYADGHRGFVLEFDADAEFFHQQDPPEWVSEDEEGTKAFREEYGLLRPVQYSSSRPSIILMEPENFNHLYMKSDHWAYEREHRMLMPLSYAVQRIERSARPPVCLFPLPPSAVTRILLGCNMHSDHQRRVLELLSRCNGASHTKVEHAYLDDERFELLFRPLLRT